MVRSGKETRATVHRDRDSVEVTKLFEKEHLYTCCKASAQRPELQQLVYVEQDLSTELKASLSIDLRLKPLVVIPPDRCVICGIATLHVRIA
jgi:hypothetical protein